MPRRTASVDSTFAICFHDPVFPEKGYGRVLGGGEEGEDKLKRDGNHLAVDDQRDRIKLPATANAECIVNIPHAIPYSGVCVYSGTYLQR
jgi:hypothetical protein